MQPVRIWVDARRNHLHLVFPAILSEAEVDSASLRLEAATRQLRPGFSITVSHELADQVDGDPVRCSATRRQGWVRRVLQGADRRLVA